MRPRGSMGVGVAVVVATSLLSASVARSAPVDHPVISQVYGGGGNAAAVYTHDYVELFNPSPTPVSLNGWSVQYASATGTGGFGFNAAQLTPLSGVLQPGQYLLVQGAEGAAGTTPLPAPDVIDATPIRIRAAGAKIALVNTAVPLGCNGGSTPCSPTQLASIVDLVAWGDADFARGTPAPETASTLALFRLGAGCVDTADNGADFTLGPPAPRNTGSAPRSCTLSLAVILDRHTAAPGDLVQVTLSTTNALPGDLMDLYVVVAIPATLAPSLGCAGSLGLVFIGSGGSTFQVACASQPPAAFTRYGANAALPTTPTILLSVTWPTAAPPGEYVFAVLATPPGAWADGVIGAADIRAMATDQLAAGP